ncbi:hypothetical protein HanIR_Chr01g0039281 [Helianthus annuus]|nr:hypothetical protein HanIR_Chr01g0039281 [Helianthus annuus]
MFQSMTPTPHSLSETSPSGTISPLNNRPPVAQSVARRSSGDCRTSSEKFSNFHSTPTLTSRFRKRQIR